MSAYPPCPPARNEPPDALVHAVDEAKGRGEDGHGHGHGDPRVGRQRRENVVDRGQLSRQGAGDGEKLGPVHVVLHDVEGMRLAREPVDCQRSAE